jgi:hypothetical protein
MAAFSNLMGKPITIMRDSIHHALHYVDLVVRIVAGVSLIPLAFLTLILSIMAGDAPSSGPIPSILIFGIGSCIIGILAISIANPDYLALKLEPYLGRARWIVRVPAYLYAPFGLYYGERILSGIVVNLI